MPVLTYHFEKDETYREESDMEEHCTPEKTPDKYGTNTRDPPNSKSENEKNPDNHSYLYPAEILKISPEQYYGEDSDTSSYDTREKSRSIPHMKREKRSTISPEKYGKWRKEDDDENFEESFEHYSKDNKTIEISQNPIPTHCHRLRVSL
jgi:hypothetical protein